MPPISRLPASLERELGTAGPGSPNSVVGVAWMDEWEAIPELRWPEAGRVYDHMRNDSQVGAVLRAMITPALARARWRLGTEGVDPRVLAFCTTELGLYGDRQARARRRREGIVWNRYLREALTHKLAFGHAAFEPVYRFGAPSPEQAAGAPGMPRLLAHLARLSLRPARTIEKIDTEPNGDLAGIRQLVLADNGTQYLEVPIPLRVPGGYRRLVFHVNEQEGSDWRGRSMQRASWKHWMIRDSLLKVGAQAVERNGMGVPVVTFDEDLVGPGARAQALEIARKFRAGDEAGTALPEGFTITLLGVSGQVRDELPLVKYHDQQIGKNALAMVLDLGHDRGARSLGDTFLELATDAENAVLCDFAEEVTEYLVRDLVAMNFGPDEPYPPVVVDELTPDEVLTAEALARLVDAGVVIPDDALEEEVRRRYNLPDFPDYRPAPGTPADVDYGMPVGLPGPDDVPPPPPPPALPPGPGTRPTEEVNARLRAVQARLAAREAARRAGRPAAA